MKKIFGMMMGAALIVTGGLMAAVTMPSPASAAIAVDDEGKLQLFGDVRFRGEYDTRNKAGKSTETRDRLRLRVRFGFLYAPTDVWSAGLRLRTASNNLNSPYQTFGFFGASGTNADLGIDRLYIKAKGSVMDGKISAWVGKNAMNFWMPSEQWWDEDIQVEGAAVTYKIDSDLGGLTLNGGYFLLSEGNWEGGNGGNQLNQDGQLVQGQVVYQTGMLGPQLTLAAGYAKIMNPDRLSDAINGVNAGVSVANPLAAPPPRLLQSSRYINLSGMVKGSNWRLAGEYIKSNALTDDTAYVLQARYTLPAFGVLHPITLRVYQYRVEGFSILGDGIFGQDNFPNPGAFGLSNFRGQRYQMDYKIDKHVTLDLRAYIAKQISSALGALQKQGTVTDALMTRESHNRYQLNLTVKF